MLQCQSMKVTATRPKISVPRREISTRWKAAAGSLRRHKKAFEKHIKKMGTRAEYMTTTELLKEARKKQKGIVVLPIDEYQRLLAAAGLF